GHGKTVLTGFGHHGDVGLFVGDGLQGLGLHRGPRVGLVQVEGEVGVGDVVDDEFLGEGTVVPTRGDEEGLVSDVGRGRVHALETGDFTDLVVDVGGVGVADAPG